MNLLLITFANSINAGISKVRIERKADQIDIEIHTARPGVVVGRGGSGIEKLRTELQDLVASQRQIRINVIEVSRVDADAALIAEYICQQLERRMSFRRVVRQAIQRAQRAEVKGIKVQVSGRLNGAEIARTEWVREGRVPLHTLRADIDYSYKTALTIYGILGVKVWIFKGEIIPGHEEVDILSQTPRRQRRRQRFDDKSMDYTLVVDRPRNNGFKSLLDKSKPKVQQNKKIKKDLTTDKLDKIDSYLIYAFDLLGRGLEPGVRVVEDENIKLLDMLIQVEDKSWNSENIKSFRETFRVDNIVGGLGNLETIKALQKDSNVSYVEAGGATGVFDIDSLQSVPKDDSFVDSLPLVKVKEVHKKEEGESAIIAFIDDGIDIFHKTFLDENNQTRILAVWDQETNQKYTKNEIQQHLDSNNIDIVSDVLKNIGNSGVCSDGSQQGGHGTCVASIAAGRAVNLFQGGIAPKTKIVVVKINRKQPLKISHGMAVEFIKKIAEKEKLPVVINISQGINAG